MKFPKVIPARNKKFREFVARQECCLTGMVTNEYESVDAHHSNPRGHGTMGGKCCDSRCVPIAHHLHNEMNQPGSSEKTVFERYGVNPEDVVEDMRRRWLVDHERFWE